MSTPTPTLEGVVQSGGTDGAQQMSKVLVTLYQATGGAPEKLGTATTDIYGRFAFYTTNLPPSDSIYYAAATWGMGITLVTIIGPRVRGPITINELTTVAAAYSMAQFVSESGEIRGEAFRLRVAAGMSENLASPLTGDSSEVMLRSPNADETNSLRCSRALANLIVPSVRGMPGAFATLQQLTTPGDDPPANTFQALVNIARNPANNVSAIYDQAKEWEIYTPALECDPNATDPSRDCYPDAWTLVVKVNRTGDDTRMFGGPANIAWDANGYAWITNNVWQGTPNSCDYAVVLQPNGKPSDGTNGTPKSPVVGGGLTGAGFGVAIDANQDVWIGSYGWGKCDGCIPDPGIVSKFDKSGVAYSAGGYTNGLHRVQAVAVDGDNNLWLASYGNNRVVVYLGCDPENWISYPPRHLSPGDTPEEVRDDAQVKAPGEEPFGIAIDPSDGSAWVTYASGLGGDVPPSHVCKFSIVDGALSLDLDLTLGKSTKGIALDSRGNAWIGSGSDNTVYMVSRDGSQVCAFPGGPGGVDTPWSVAVDGNDDVWVANFGVIEPGSDYTNAAVSKLAGVGSPPGLPVGSPLTPGTGYTLKTAGSPVLLANGEPLYEHGQSYSPLMRMTNVVVDAAGNLWAINNWKPRFGTDYPERAGNPGGDGICIFVGLAKPLAKAS